MIRGAIMVSVGVVVAPLLGGLIAGSDRRLTAWLQSRYGPPVWQPFFDVMKLFGKERLVVNSWQVFCAYVYVTGAMLSVVLFFLRSDLLLILFVQAVGAIFLVIGAFSTTSPFSQVGANRELIQILTYEPLIVLVFVGIYLVTGSFKISEIYAQGRPLLKSLPLLYMVLCYALTIKLRKSPFDFSTSHHGHQEVVKGFLTEYSGPYLALVEIGHWYEVVLILGLCSLFWATSWIGIIVLVGITYLFEILIDNIMARMTWRWMLGYIWSMGLAMSFINLIWLHGR